MSTNIGLEISATAVRIAKVSVKGHHKSLIAFAEAALPQGAVVDGAIVNPDAVATAIKQCLTVPRLKSGGLQKTTSVNLSVSGLRAISREIEVPSVPDNELDEAVKLQAIDFIPFPAEKTLLSARRISSTQASPGQPIKVMLAAAHSDLVYPLLDVISSVDLIPKNIDLASSALIRSLGDNITTRSGPEAIVSVGADLTLVVIHDAGRPIFVRTISEGGNSVTKAIAASLDIPLSDADNIKKYVGRPDRHTPPVAVAAARDASAKLITEIKNSIDYFTSTYSGMQIRRLLITGGGSRLTGFIDRLTQALPIPVERASCLKGVQGEKIGQDTAPGSQLDDVAAVAIGLAIPEPPNIKRINLLPPDFVSSKKLKHTSRLIAVAVIVIILILAGFYGYKLLGIHNAENVVGHDQAQINQLNATIPKYNYVAIETKELITDKGIALSAVADEVNWPLVLKSLNTTMPKQLIVTSFSGTTASAPATPQPTSTSSSTPTQSYSLPLPTQVIGTLQLGLKGVSGNSGYQTFYNWAKATYKYGKFQYTNYSGISSTATSPATWSAGINILGSIHTSRYAKFDPTTPVIP